MKENLLSYIDNQLLYGCSDPVEQIIYFIARLSVTASPVAWMVKRLGENADKPFVSYEEALNFIRENGEKGDCIYPLFAAAKADIFSAGLKRFL